MNLPNYLSVIRMMLVAAFVGLLLYYTPERAYFRTLSIVVFMVACATDALDGFIARRLDQKTQLGSYLDPIADKLLLVSGFLSLSFMSHLPAATHIPIWVTIPVITRDGLILLGSILIFLTTGKLKAQPLAIGKLTTFFQMTTLFFALLGSPHVLLMGLFYSTVILTVLSGVRYFAMFNRLFGPR